MTKKYNLKNHILHIICALILILILSINAKCHALGGDFNGSYTIVINSSGQAVSGSNIFTTDATSNTPNEVEVKGPGPYVSDLTLDTHTSGGKKTIDGRPAFQLYDYAGNAVPNVWFSLGVRQNGVDQFLDKTTSIAGPEFTNPDAPQTLKVVLALASPGKTSITPGHYSISPTYVGTQYVTTAASYNSGIYQGGNGSGSFIRLIMDLTVVSSTCQVQTSRDISVEWPSLTPSDIKNNTSENKPSTITVNCEDTSSHPMNVTVSGSNGYADAANGIVNTSAKDLGLQLTWVSNGQPIPLGQPISFDPGADGMKKQDLSIAAKPIATGDKNISGGDFATDVTVTMEYR